MAELTGKPLKGRRVAVLGSSAAGIAAAITLSVRGARVVVLEEEDQLLPEWCERTAGPYRFGPWPPFLLSPGRLGELFDTADFRLTDFLDLERVSLLGEFRLPGASPVALVPNMDGFRAELERIDKDDARRFHALLKRCHHFWRIEEAFLSRGLPPSRWQAIHPRVTPFLHVLLDPRGAHPYAQRPFRSPEIRRILAALCETLGVRVYTDPAIGLARLYELFHFGGWRIEGGGEALRQALSRLARELRVRFIRNVRVDRIDLQNGRVRRISGSGFRPFAVSLAISTWPHQRTSECFSEPFENPNPISQQNEFVLHAGFKQTWEGMRNLTILPPDDPLESSRQQNRWGIPSPAGTVCVYTGSKAPGGHTAMSIRTEVPAPNYRHTWTDNHQQAMEQRLYARLEDAGFDDVRAALAEREVVAPQSIALEAPEEFRWRAFRRPCLPIARFLHHDPRMPIPGLYQTRQTPCHPAGAAASIQAGIAAAEAAIRDA